MNTFIVALLPVFGTIVVGYLFKRYTFPGDAFWPLAARITYFAFFPALLINNLAPAQLADLAIGRLILAVLLPTLLVALAVTLARPYLRISGVAFTSVFQGSIRFNTYVGLAAIAALYGSPGITLVAIILAVLVPLVNVLSVLMLTRHGSVRSLHWRDTLLALAQNPLIIACVLGIALNLSGIGLPFVTGELLEIFARAALPMGLLTVGADLDLRAVRTGVLPVLVSSGVKLLILPLLTALACWLLGIGDLAMAVAVIFAALPTATSAYILAQQMGGDAQLMAGLLTVQTLAAVVTMPLVLLLLV
ncbi:MAG: AEC family transporter [Chloroflexaceae bacterium]